MRSLHLFGLLIFLSSSLECPWSSEIYNLLISVKLRSFVGFRHCLKSSMSLKFKRLRICWIVNGLKISYLNNIHLKNLWIWIKSWYIVWNLSCKKKSSFDYSMILHWFDHFFLSFNWHNSNFFAKIYKEKANFGEKLLYFISNKFLFSEWKKKIWRKKPLRQTVPVKTPHEECMWGRKFVIDLNRKLLSISRGEKKKKKIEMSWFEIWVLLILILLGFENL